VRISFFLKGWETAECPVQYAGWGGRWNLFIKFRTEVGSTGRGWKNGGTKYSLVRKRGEWQSLTKGGGGCTSHPLLGAP